VQVPLTNASITAAVFEVEKTVTAEEVNELLRAAARSHLKDILQARCSLLATVHPAAASGRRINAPCMLPTFGRGDLRMRTRHSTIVPAPAQSKIVCQRAADQHLKRNASTHARKSRRLCSCRWTL
jgi:Glyceraldehyde 3-phosphate dehydrogenase, C-terminal domain